MGVLLQFGGSAQLISQCSSRIQLMENKSFVFVLKMLFASFLQGSKQTNLTQGNNLDTNPFVYVHIWKKTQLK